MRTPNPKFGRVVSKKAAKNAKVKRKTARHTFKGSNLSGDYFSGSTRTIRTRTYPGAKKTKTKTHTFKGTDLNGNTITGRTATIRTRKAPTGSKVRVRLSSNPRRAL